MTEYFEERIEDKFMGGKSKMPQIGEAIFCIIYLLFGCIAGGVMLIHSNRNMTSNILGILTLVLAGGDSFHLVPRIINAFSDKFEKYEFWAGLGLMVSSITMTVFYILLYIACGNMSGEKADASAYGLWYYALLVLSIIRIICCLLPQNNWFNKEGNPKLGVIRNIPFIGVGIIAIYGCIIAGQIGMAIAIVISFACYLPVVFFAKKTPMVGMLMIPKTIAYMWIICILLGMVL